MHNRKLNRLPEFDHRSPGYYFVTICVKNFIPYFGDIRNGIMCLNEYGSVIYDRWKWLEQQYPYVSIDAVIVMPNHTHAIVCIDDLSVGNVGAGLDLPLRNTNLPLSNIIGAFKTTSSKEIHNKGLAEFNWQRSFYDVIIDNDKSLSKIRNYITYNPMKWNRDRNKKNMKY